jgi:hypothetical protein
MGNSCGHPPAVVEDGKQPPARSLDAQAAKVRSCCPVEAVVQAWGARLSTHFAPHRAMTRLDLPGQTPSASGACLTQSERTDCSCEAGRWAVAGCARHRHAGHRRTSSVTRACAGGGQRAGCRGVRSRGACRCQGSFTARAAQRSAGGRAAGDAVAARRAGVCRRGGRVRGGSAGTPSAAAAQCVCRGGRRCQRRGRRR